MEDVNNTQEQDETGRQQYRRQKIGDTVPKTQYQPKSSSQSQMHSQNLKTFGIVTSTLLCGNDSSGVGLYFGCQNIPSKAK